MGYVSSTMRLDTEQQRLQEDLHSVPAHESCHVRVERMKAEKSY